MAACELDPIYKELAGRLGMEDSPSLQRILAKLATLSQAKIVRELPATPAEIAERLGLDEAEVEQTLQELFEKGLLFPTRKGYQMARSFTQFHDSQTNPKFDEELGREYFELWHKLTHEEVAKAEGGLLEAIAGGPVPAWRVVPRWKSVADTGEALPCDDVRELLRAFTPLAIIPCVCQRLHPESTCGTPNTKCIVFGRTAQYHIARGDARELTPEEAIDLLEEFDELGLIHLTLNQKAVNSLLCNFHSCCCDTMVPLMGQQKYALTDGIAKSRFEVVLDTEACKGCGTCVATCQFGAASVVTDTATGRKQAVVDIDKCMGCGACVLKCPSKARSMKAVRPEEHVPDSIAAFY